MYEAADHSGMNPAIWVKYRGSIFHNNYNNKYCIAWNKNKAENPIVGWMIKKKADKKRKFNLLSDAVVKPRISYRVSGFVHLKIITTGRILHSYILPGTIDISEWYR